MIITKHQTSRFITFVNKKPKIFLLLSCIIFLILSTYPVIFLNKSFVSPSGVPQLSDSGDILPGYKNENSGYLGDDRGAMLWGVAPSMSVAYDSIIKYKEFPFWNRYVGGGTPLFAQTNDLIIDPTNIFFIFFGQNSWSYDLKFLFSRLLFSFGISILVLRFTKSVGSAFFIGVSSIFLGYYQSRFNHPALFVLTYMPWALIGWETITRSFLDGRSKLSKITHASLLVIFSFLLINSGPVKETAPATLFIHIFGFIYFIYSVHNTYSIKKSFFIVCVISAALLFSSVFYTYLFFDLLHKSFSVYDNPGVNQLPINNILGYFQPVFNKDLQGFTSNIFYLFAITLLFRLRHIIKKLFFVRLALIISLILVFIIYGLIPNVILIKIPYFNNIHHIQNVLGSPLFLFTAILSGFAIKEYFKFSSENKAEHFRNFLYIYVALYLLYASINKFHLFAPFIYSFLFLNLIYFFLVKYPKTQSSTLFITFIILCLANSQHHRSGFNFIDNKLLIPTSRVDYLKNSKAIIFVKNYIQEHGPTRIIGYESILFPGYNARLGLESLVSVEPLRNHLIESYYDSIGFGYANDWGWLRLLNEKNIISANKGLDLMNVGLVITKLGTQLPNGYSLIFQDDYMVWKNENYWPRAFYTNLIFSMKKDEEISDLINKSEQGKFFASIDSNTLKSLNFSPDKKNDFLFTSSINYKLTNNSTSFDISVLQAGIVVLTEAYYPGDFKVFIDGRPINYFRVNQSFKGIFVKDAGFHHVEFFYEPEHLKKALYLTLLGFLLPLLLFLV